MMKMNGLKKCFYAVLIAGVLLTGALVSGVILSTPQTAYSQAPEPKCVCAECGYPCGSGHAKSCSFYRPR